MSIKSHFSKHGYIHCFWIIVLLCATCAALLIATPSGEKVNSYLSFASSIASLILAVVAIIYSFVADQGRHEASGLLQNSAKNIAEGSQTLSDLSERVSEKIELVLGQVTGIREPINLIQQALADRTELVDIFPSVTGLAEESSGGFFKKAPIQGAAIAFYAVAKSSESGINKLNPYALYRDNTVFLNALLGVLETLRCLEPYGIKLQRIQVKERDEESSAQWLYTILDFPAEIRKEVLQNTDDGYADFEKYAKLIDAHIATLAE